MTDFETWLYDFGYDVIFRMIELRNSWQYTPYEIKMDHTSLSLKNINNDYTYIQILEVIELPDKNILIGYKVINCKDDLFKNDDKVPRYYRKLSDIKLSYFPEDQICSNWK